MIFSIICIVNNQEMFDGFKASLNTQDLADYELIPVMNMNNEWAGARPAFNNAAGRAQGDYLMFIHPDVRFLADDALSCMYKWISEGHLPENWAVAGAAGAARAGNDREIVTAIIQGEQKQPVGRSIDEPESVQTLDECLFIVKREYFEKHKFPDNPGWHLYAAEYCLDCIRDGMENYVIPAQIWHMSDGKSLDPSYVVQINKLIEKEKDYFDIICTTVKAWKTKGAGAAAYRAYYYRKQQLKKKLKK